MYNRLAVLCLFLFSLGFVSALPPPNVVARQDASQTISAAFTMPTSITTTNVIQTPNGNMTETCVITLIPNGQTIQEVQNCTTTMGTVNSANAPSGTDVPTPSTPSASPMVAPAAAFVLPGTKILVLPVGLGIFGGITSIAIGFVAFVTWERVQYRRAFRQQRMAETTIYNSLNKSGFSD